MSQLAKRARHPSQLLELPVTKTTLLNTPFQLTTPIDTRHGIPQADAVANSAVVEEKLIGGSRPNVACLPSKNIIHSAKGEGTRNARRRSDSKTGSIFGSDRRRRSVLRGFRRRTCTSTRQVGNTDCSVARSGGDANRRSAGPCPTLSLSGSACRSSGTCS